MCLAVQDSSKTLQLVMIPKSRSDRSSASLSWSRDHIHREMLLPKKSVLDQSYTLSTCRKTPIPSDDLPLGDKGYVPDFF